jgi:hypothetical protein
VLGDPLAAVPVVGGLFIVLLALGPFIAVRQLEVDGLRRLPPTRRPAVARAVWLVALAWLLIMLVITVSVVG